tara:strand:- start:134 stop:472 length:339 start_codon:yes stop_codon:yes gene_type:complete
MSFKKEKSKLLQDFLNQLINKYPSLPCIKVLESDKKLMNLVKINKKNIYLNSFNKEDNIKDIERKENNTDFELIFIDNKEYLFNKNNYSIKDIETMKIIGKWSILDESIKYD